MSCTDINWDKSQIKLGSVLRFETTYSLEPITDLEAILVESDCYAKLRVVREVYARSNKKLEAPGVEWKPKSRLLIIAPLAWGVELRAALTNPTLSYIMRTPVRDISIRYTGRSTTPDVFIHVGTCVRGHNMFGVTCDTLPCQSLVAEIFRDELLNCIVILGAEDVLPEDVVENPISDIYW